MTDCNVSVRGEDHEEETAGDLVDGGGGEVDLAHGGAEGPLPHEHGDNQEGDPNEEALVRHCKVQDVGVRHLRKLKVKPTILRGCQRVYRVHF